MKKLEYICCQPAITYYVWQIEVMINNFIEMQVAPSDINILCAIENNIIPPDWIKLQNGYPFVKFFFYNDTREHKSYAASIYFNLMKQHIKSIPGVENTVFFVHDSDILFTKVPEFNSMIDDNIWYCSDTINYINYDYIQKKGNHIYEKMCDIVGIDKLIPKLMNSNSGGAQYIVKNTTYEFWEKVENDSITLYKYFCNEELNYIKSDENGYPIQKWTAGMWSLLWNAWLYGNETKVDNRMSFSWPTWDISLIENHSIFHNAGVTEENCEGLFFKSKYMTQLPYHLNLNIDKQKASYYYWNEICKTAKKSVLIDNSVEFIIKRDLEKYKISQLQLDPYGICNAKCWYCPVKYLGNPAEGKDIMSVELLEKIIKNLIDEREKENGLVDKNFNGFYTSHYNEILLYPHFEDLLKICRKYKLITMILSNGIPLTPDKIDLLQEYEDVLSGICLNIPAFDAETWSKRSGINIKQFDKLISNIQYAINKLPNMVNNKAFSIQINGVNNLSFTENGGALEMGNNFPNDINLNTQDGELAKQEQLAKKLFPNVNIFTVPYLIDRAGLLNDVISNKSYIEKNLMSSNTDKKVIGCRYDKNIGGRTAGWLHINSSGHAFVCCNDFHFDFKFGDFKTQELKDFWGKDEQITQIKKSYETMCKNCASAIFE